MTARHAERREAVAEYLCEGCPHEPHAGPCRVILGQQFALDGGTVATRCTCPATNDTTRPRMEGFE